MIELLFAIATGSAIPLGVVLAIRILVGQAAGAAWTTAVVAAAAGLAVVSLAIGRGPIAAVLAGPWWVAATGVAGASGLALLRDILRNRALGEAWRIGASVACAFLAVGATWLALDRAAVQPFGFDRTIVLLTAVHFHVAGFALTLAGSLAARRRPGVAVRAMVAALIVGTPMTALGFFGFPLVSWLGALLVAIGGIGIGIATVAISGGVADRVPRGALRVAGSTLFVTMPLAAAYATGTTFRTPILDIPAMAALHGSLNVVGFAIPSMIGWTLLDRPGDDTRGGRGPGPARPRDVIGFNRWPFVAGLSIGLLVVIVILVVALPDLIRIALGLAGIGAIAQTSAAMFATWRVFGPDAAGRWEWIGLVALGSARWLNLTTGFDDSTGRLHEVASGVAAAIDVFDAARPHAAALHRARSMFPPSDRPIPIGGLDAAVEPASVDTVFLLMSAHETHGRERAALFAAASRALTAGGRIVVVEHLRDPANIVAFGPGAWHFSGREDWLRIAAGTGLRLVEERRLDPWVSGFIFERAAG